jgi:hypothetical protein
LYWILIPASLDELPQPIVAQPLRSSRTLPSRHSGFIVLDGQRAPHECLFDVNTVSSSPPKTPLVHTSIATMANVKISLSLVAIPPPKISGAAHIVVIAGLGSWRLGTELFPRMMVVSPKSTRRARSSLSIRTLAFEFTGIKFDSEKGRKK